MVAARDHINALQHRTHIFSVYLELDGWSRLIRWDSSGAVVSHRFQAASPNSLLAVFLWRLSRMSPAERGIDTTITPASREEAWKAHHAISFFKKDKCIYDEFPNNVNPYETLDPCPSYFDHKNYIKIEIPDGKDSDIVTESNDAPALAEVPAPANVIGSNTPISAEVMYSNDFPASDVVTESTPPVAAEMTASTNASNDKEPREIRYVIAKKSELPPLAPTGKFLAFFLPTMSSSPV